jgi:hypothetical protein
VTPQAAIANAAARVSRFPAFAITMFVPVIESAAVTPSPAASGLIAANPFGRSTAWPKGSTASVPAGNVMPVSRGWTSGPRRRGRRCDAPIVEAATTA